MQTLASFLSFIKEHALFNQQDRVLLAVSGGRDSALMAYLFGQAGFRFGIAHCNFQLRGQEADDEEEFTSALARNLQVPFFSTRFNTSDYAQEQQISIQMAARDLRYQWLEEIRADFDFQYIAVAHHQNDAIETLLLNLTRGTGIAGMHGILPKRDKLIRPLLFLNREEIDNWVKTENIPYRDDSSNSSTKYARNKIRLEVIPRLKELNPRLEETFAGNIRRFAELEILLNSQIESLKKEILIPSPSGEYNIRLSALKNLYPLKTLLYDLFREFHFTEKVLDDLIHSWDHQPGKVFFSATHQLLLDREQVILASKKSEAFEECLIDPGTTEYSWNGQQFELEISSIENFQLKKVNHIAQADFDLLRFPLVLRSWKDGDSFQPLGMKGQKKLSDFFISQKIPQNRKHKIGVLQNGDGQIIWVSGYRLSEHFKINSSTKKIFIFENLSIYGK